MKQVNNVNQRVNERWFTHILYNSGIRSYRAAVHLASLRNRKARLMCKGHKAVWRILEEKLDANAKYIWIHTSSLGEFEQGRPLIERIHREAPQYKIILTFFSPSGYEVRRNYSGADIVCYLPFDTPSNAAMFVERVNPCMAIFVKYEFWRNYLIALQRHGVPTYLISGIFRSSQLFFKSHGKWYRNMLRYFTHLYVQDEGSRSLLESVDMHNVTVAGDTRFDRVTDIMQGCRELPFLTEFSKDKKFIFMAGSSWPADEAIYFPWLKAHKEVKAVIAPHEFDYKRVADICAAFPGECVAWTELENDPKLIEGKRIVVMNCMGLLSSAYRYANVAYIGGGFGSGLHNINEAAVYGIPVIFGPNNAKFIEAQEIQQCSAGFEVHSAEELSSIATKLLNDAKYRSEAGTAAAKYIKSKLGATEIIYHDLFES
jgi:3-deoxy-D-manno-octulosonic-acid transferase